MKHFTNLVLALFLAIALVHTAAAIDIVPSSENIRLNSTQDSTSFTLTLNDNIDKLSKKSGNLKVKLKYDKKLFTLSPVAISIPYVNGVFGEWLSPRILNN